MGCLTTSLRMEYCIGPLYLQFIILSYIIIQYIIIIILSYIIIQYIIIIILSYIIMQYIIIIILQACGLHNQV